MNLYSPSDVTFDTARRSAFSKTGQVRRSTLVALRWMAVIGQTVSMLVVHFGLRIDLPILACGSVIALSALVNLGIMYVAPRDIRVPNSEAGAQLLFDCVQLAVLLYLTGGMLNPFALLLLAPVVVSAKTLDIGVFVCLAVAVSVMSFFLLFFHLPLPWFNGQTLLLPTFYLYGAWVALMVGMLFISSYTWRTTVETRRITQALAATDVILAHEQKLSALGGLAAAAAHKLGTPLSTIRLVAKEIENNAKPHSALAEDAVLVRTQADICHEILMDLSAQGDLGDEVYDRLSLPDLLQEITAPCVREDKTVSTKIVMPWENAEMPVRLRRPELVYGLTNIIENAVDFATKEVDVIATWSTSEIEIEILDDGPGFAASVLVKVGEPYISYRPENHQAAGGLGLGVFIATMLIHRVGGDIKITNRKNTSGARVKMTWPLDLE